MGSQTASPSRSSRPGSLIANSTRSALPGRVATLSSYWSGTRMSSRRLPSCISPQVPAGLDVGQDLLQVADAGRQRLHLAEPLVDLLQPVADQLEGLAEPALQRALELLVDRVAHLLELAGVVGLDLGQLRLDGRAQAVELLLVAFGQAPQLGRKAVHLLLGQGDKFRDLPEDGVVDAIAARPPSPPAGPATCPDDSSRPRARSSFTSRPIRSWPRASSSSRGKSGDGLVRRAPPQQDRRGRSRDGQKKQDSTAAISRNDTGDPPLARRRRLKEFLYQITKRIVRSQFAVRAVSPALRAWRPEGP